jgi:hypothetical protein
MPTQKEKTEVTKLAKPELWVLHRMNEMELAEMIERHIDYYVEYANGFRRSVHLPMQFVRHYLQRQNDDVLPTAVAISQAPLVLADGNLLAPDGLDRERGIIFIIPKDLRAVVPAAEDCTQECVRVAMDFLCDEWLCDVATDYTGKCTIIAAALTVIERSLLPERPAFFVTAGRRGGGKTTTILMLLIGVTGIWPTVSAFSTNEEERRKVLLSQFMISMPYILWDNIARGTQISCPHIEKSCTSAYYADRKLGVSEMVSTAASTIHFFTGNNVGPRGDLASRSLHIRLDVDRPDPENRKFWHPTPIGWTEDHRAEIMAALYTILLGNPQLAAPRDAPGRTRFKMWWRLIGSAVEHAAGLAGHEVDFQTLFLDQEEDDEESASLADVLGVLAAAYPKEFLAKDVAELVNSYWSGSDDEKSNKKLVRDFLLPGATNDHVFSAKSIGRLLKKHLDNVVITETGGMLVLRKREGYAKAGFYHVDRCAVGTASTLDPGETGEDGANQEAGEVATASQDPDGQKTRTGASPSGDDGDDPDVAELLNLSKDQPARDGS